MSTPRTLLILATALLFAPPVFAQWTVHVQDQTGAWEELQVPDREKDGVITESEARARAGRYCIHRSVPHHDPRMRVAAVKIVGPGLSPDQARSLSCDELGEIMGEDLTRHDRASPQSSTSPAPDAAVATDSRAVAQPPALPNLNDVSRNPGQAIRGWLNKLASGATEAPPIATPSGTAQPVPGAAMAIPPRSDTSSLFDVVGLRLGMASADTDRIVRGHMQVGWVFVRDRNRFPSRANTYESMKGYLAGDLSEAILVYFEPSLSNGTLVGVRRFSMIGQKVDPGALETALVQKYGPPAVARNDNWVWGQPAGCSASGTGVLEPQALKFLEGPARTDPAFRQAIATALDLATYNTAVDREYWARCAPVLAILRSANNGVMTTLVDQKFTMDKLAPESYDAGAMEF